MSTKKIVLKSSDDVTFEVEEAVALQSKILAHQIEDDCIDNGIPVTNVSSNILKLVIDYCKKHVQAGSSSEDDPIKKWDAEFVSGLEQPTIFDIVLASNYMNIPSLLDLTSQRIADMLAACKDTKEIRDNFDIVDDFEPGEEEKIRQENQWAFQ